jgi:drug/metabolite transporter (DMT)-like permease
MFAGLLSVWLLKRKQRSYHWLGMAICTTGVIVIGVCSVFQNSGKDGHGNGAAGMILILFGTFASAVRPSPHSCGCLGKWQPYFFCFAWTCCAGVESGANRG